MSESNAAQQKERLLQQDWIARVNRIGSEQWVTVYHQHKDELEDYGFFCAFVPTSDIGKILNSHTWDFSIGDGKPGCSVSYIDGGEQVLYHRFGNDECIEPFVIFRTFHGAKPSYLGISEEFRLFHNLYHDTVNNKYIKIDEYGEDEDSVIMEEQLVRVRLKHLRQFLAVKETACAVYFDIHRFSPSTVENLGLKGVEREHRSDALRYVLYIQDFQWAISGKESRRTRSRLLGKKLIFGIAKEKSGFWPYDEEEKEYVDFIIGIDADGNERVHSSDPSKLSNYFGANPGAPHYLTPVFFRREVLSKYHARTERYTVSDGLLRCAAIWDLRIDNNHSRYVIAHLGDLGSSLNHKEQLYWRSFNVVPDGSFSDVHWKRAFMAEFADPEKADLRFKYRFEIFQEAWQAAMGWPLFRPLTEKDAHFYQSIRVPLTNDQSEFDHQVLGLTKLLIDSLNESKLVQEVATALPENAKGIAKFEAFLKSKGASGFEEHLKFLRNLQTLRSTGVGHRKGKEFEKIARVFRLEDRDLMTVFEDILIDVCCLLDYLESSLIR